MKLALFTFAALFWAVASAQVRPQTFKRDGAPPTLAPATPLTCHIIASTLSGHCALANYPGCEETLAYAQCICEAQNDPTQILKCATATLDGLLKSYCVNKS
ncbi:MAG: hypothetical protein JOS17DRAFT_737014 [Linnemannia elongata]|nr:MAG: hypothetical protein JOS17DRAFT_737014 [Linnemannia elongata]